MVTDPPIDPISVSNSVGLILDQVGVPYFIGGSIASSLLGEYRFTNDVDFVAELSLSQLGSLVQSLGADYYISEDAARRAVAEGGSFNLIHIPSVQKIDIFVSRNSPFEKEQMARRRSMEIRPGIRLFMASPEDLIVSKLVWFKKGGSVSDRQWRDVLGVLKV
ncbi:MAG: hypothetical protein V1495_09145, partial [Pseudomonadota bacterium]